MIGCIQRYVDNLRPVESSDTAAEENSLLSKKILVVEDQIDTRESLSLLLTLTGFDVTTAENGQQALHTLQSFQPDLIITDIGMPYLNGINLMQRIREQMRFKALPIIAMTGYRSLKQMADEAGANETLIKPTDFDELILIINRLLAL